MLQRLGDHIRNCMDHAAEAEAIAARSSDPQVKAEYLEMAQRWTQLARSYQFVESLERFLLDAERARREFQPRPPETT